MPDHGDLLSAMQSHAIENLWMAGNFVMRDHCAIEHGEHVKNAGCCSNASQNTILLGQYGAYGALVGINAGVAGRIARGPVFEQRVFKDCRNAPAVKVHICSCGDSRPRLSGRATLDKLFHSETEIGSATRGQPRAAVPTLFSSVRPTSF